MLLGNRAIFGALSFDDEQVAARRVGEIETRARRLGAMTRSWRRGPAVLGVADRGARESLQPEPETSAVVAGEIFNGGDLLFELSGRAVTSAPSPVTVLDQTLAAWGTRCFARIDGAFVAAAWDSRERRLILACDRSGDAHVYYHADASGIVFASWLPLIAHLARGIDRGAVKAFLRFLYITAPQSIYEGIARLAPGTHLVASGHGTQTTSHPGHLPSWRGIDFSSWSEADALDTVDNLLTRAIQRRLGDRRVGIFLSSGVDSATIAAIHQRLYPGRAAGITVAFADRELDESDSTRAFAAEIGLEHRVFRFTLPDYRHAVDEMAAGFDQPFADPAGLPIVLACRRTGTDVDLFSGGTGGDDLLDAPVPRHLWASLAIAARIPRSPRIGLARVLGAFPPTAGRAPIFDFEEPQELLITWPGWTRRDLERLFQESVRFDDTAFYTAFRAAQSGGPRAILNALGSFPPDDCRFEGAGLVGRLIHFPYHDPELRSFLWSLPPRPRATEGRMKVLLRGLLARHAPHAAGRSVKRYFNVPLADILAYRDHEVVRDYLDPGLVRRAGLVEPAALAPWLDRYLAGDGSLTFKIWALVVLHAWVSHHA